MRALQLETEGFVDGDGEGAKNGIVVESREAGKQGTPHIFIKAGFGRYISQMAYF